MEKHEPDTSLSWAIYLREFGSYMPPLPEGPAVSLTDCNVTYKRATLDAIADIWADAFHEPQVHAALRARRETLWLSSKLLTYQQRTLQFRPALAERYDFGRLYGSLRVAAAPAWKRLVLIAGSPLLPAWLLARVVFGVLQKRRHMRACLAAFPYLALFATVWAWGEFIGYLTGRAVVLAKDKLLGPCYFRYTDPPTAFFQFDALKRIIRSEYRIEQDTDDYTLFRRKDDIPAVPRAATAPG